MIKSLIISVILLAGCSNTDVEMVSNACSLSEYVADKNKIFDRKWSKKITLKGGLSDSGVYKMSDSRDSYVLKDISHRSRNDRIREIHAHKIASEHAYGPKLYAYDVSKGKIVMSFLTNSNQTLDQHTQIVKIVKALKKMHRGQAFCDHTSIIAQIKELYDKIIFYPEVIEKNKISNLLDQISVLESYPKNATHRDLNPNNIFFTDNDVKFIDFENAGQDDLFFDIASVITFYQYSKDAEKKFLKLYFGRELLKDEQAHLKLMKKTVSLFYGLTLMSKLPHFRKIVDAPVPNLQEILKKVSDGSLSLEKEENMMLLSLSFLLNAIDIN